MLHAPDFNEVALEAPKPKELDEPHIPLFVIYDREPMIAVIQREKNGEIYWDLAGGKKDFIEESGADAAARELWEETNLFVRMGELLLSKPHPAKQNRERYLYKAEYESGIDEFVNKVPEEHLDAKILPLEEGMALVGQIRLPEAARTYLREEAARLEAQHKIQIAQAAAALRPGPVMPAFTAV